MIPLLYKRLIQLGKVTGAVSFLVAAPYALLQYKQSQETSRVEQTLNLFKMYNAAPYTGYREKLTKALIKHKEKIDEASANEDEFRSLQFKILREDDFETETLLLFDFFDGVAVCVTSKLCDNDAAIKLFKPRAADIYINFYQYMVAQRGKTATRQFGVGLEAIAKSSLPSAEAESW